MSNQHNRVLSQESFYLYGIELLSNAPDGGFDLSAIDIGVPASIESSNLSFEDDDYVYSDDENSLQDSFEGQHTVPMKENTMMLNEARETTSFNNDDNTTGKLIQLQKKRRVSSGTKREYDNLIKILANDGSVPRSMNREQSVNGLELKANTNYVKNKEY